MKKVVIDASSCMIGSWSPFLSGIGRTTLELIRALEERENLPFELALFTQRLSSDRLQRYHFKSKQYNLPLPRKAWISRIKRVLPVVETMTGCDLCHIPHNYGDFFRGNRTVLTIHDALMFEMREDHLFDPGFKEIIRKQARRCRAILTVSRSSKELLLKHLDIPEDKITVAYWGYDKNIFRELPDDEVREALERKFRICHPYLFSVSCSIGRKRTPELIRQYLKCAEHDYPFDLVLVWRSLPETLQNEISAHPAGKRIKVLRGVTDEELALLYNGSVCTVFPSVHEGFGLPLLESMACGTPVLTTRATSLPEVAGNAGIYTQSLEEDAIGVELMNLAEKKYDLVDLKKKSLLRAQDFSWSKCAETVIDFYLRNID